MRRIGLPMALAYVFASALGCEHQTATPSRHAAAGPRSGAPPVAAPKAAGHLEAATFTARVKGRVVFSGERPGVERADVPKGKQDQGCPAQVLARGWYVDKSSDRKGVRFAVVFLKSSDGRKMPRPPEDFFKPQDGREIAEMRQPSCQFEPHVVLCGPLQKLKVYNDSRPGLSHDANFSGPATYSKTLAAGGDVVCDIDADDDVPYKVSCQQHSPFMGGWVWKFKHPWAAVTNENGEYEIKNVPVPTNGKFELMVWHEMLEGANGMKKVKEIAPKDGATETVDIAIPK